MKVQILYSWLTVLLVICGGLSLTSSAKADQYDIYLIGGQSNIEGVGRPSFLTPAQANQPDVMMYHSSSVGSAANANQWTTLKPAGWKGVSGGFGPEIGFGERLHELEPDANIAVIKHGVGGTDLAVDWNPGDLSGGTGGGGRAPAPFGPQYTTFRNTANAALTKLTDQGHTYTIKGMLWQQGEQDAKFASMSSKYEANLIHFIARMREDFDAPSMAFVYGNVLPEAIGSHPTDISGRFPYRDVVRQAQANVDQNSGMPGATDGAFMVNTDDLLTHGDAKDGFRDADFVHFNDTALLGLGHAFAEQMHEATIPEPATMVLLGLGSLLIARRR